MLNRFPLRRRQFTDCAMSVAMCYIGGRYIGSKAVVVHKPIGRMNSEILLTAVINREEELKIGLTSWTGFLPHELKRGITINQFHEAFLYSCSKF